MLQNKNVLAAKKIVFKEGDSAQKLYLIKSGKVICLKQSKDRLIPIFTAGVDDIIGENAMIKDGLNAYTAISLTQVELVEIPATNFTAVFREAPEWLVELTKTMVSRFQKTANLVAENRVVSPHLVDEVVFSDEAEVEFKRIIDPKPPRS